MAYPTMKEVEAADRVQLARWYRFLSSPGLSAASHTRGIFQKRLQTETEIMKHIIARFKEMGGMTPEICPGNSRLRTSCSKAWWLP